MIAPTTRSRLTWLHGWLGFGLGVLLICVFTTGTLSVFDREITDWMEPEISPDTPAFSPSALDAVRPAILALQKQGENPLLDLPTARDPHLRLLHYDGHELVEDSFDPATGAPQPARQTAGGSFLFELHANMRSGPFGVKTIMLAGLGLMMILTAGVLIHLRQIFTRLPLLRPFAPRIVAWRDVHLLAAVPILPFLFVMTYSGLVIHGRNILPPLPWLAAAPSPAHPAPNPEALPRPKNRHTPLAGDPPSIPPLAPIYHAAEAVLGQGQAGRILFSDSSIYVTRRDSSGPKLTEAHVDFSRLDAHQIRYVHHDAPLVQANQILRGVHFARWANDDVRWLYFLAGLGSSAMVGSGMVLFLIKRRPQHGQTVLFRLAEGLTIATSLCLPLAVLSYLWANRLIPAHLPGRALMEAHAFGSVWAISAAVALILSLSGHARAGWRLILGCLAFAGLLLPLLDLGTRPTVLIWHRPTVFATIDIMALLAGLFSLQGLRKT